MQKALLKKEDINSLDASSTWQVPVGSWLCVYELRPGIRQTFSKLPNVSEVFKLKWRHPLEETNTVRWFHPKPIIYSGMEYYTGQAYSEQNKNNIYSQIVMRIHLFWALEYV